MNAHGGVNGKKVRLVSVDYGYKIPEAVAAYKRLVADEKVIMINGWGTGDTLALKDLVNKDKIPYFSALRRRPHRPLEDALQLLRRAELLGRDPRLAHLGEGRLEGQEPNPKVAFFYGDKRYGKAPIEAGRRRKERDRLVDEEIVPET